MKVPAGILIKFYRMKALKELGFYLAARSIGTNSAGYFDILSAGSLCGVKPRTAYYRLSRCIELGLVVKVGQRYRAVAIHKVMVLHNAYGNAVAELKDYHLLYLKSVTQVVAARMFLDFQRRANTDKRDVQPKNVGQYALSLAAEYLDISIATASRNRAKAQQHKISKFHSVIKHRLNLKPDEVAHYHIDRPILQDSNGFFIENGIKEVYLISMYYSKGYSLRANKYKRSAEASRSL